MKPYLLILCFCTSLTALGQGTLTFTPSSMGALQCFPDPTSAAQGTTQSFTFSTPAVSLANYNSLQAVFSAPPGYAWRVDDDYGHPNNYYFDCAIAYGSAANGLPVVTYINYTFNFVPGMSSTVSTSRGLNPWIYETGFGFDAQFQFGGVVEFTGVTITMDYATQHDWQVAQRPLSPFSQSGVGVLPTGYGPLPLQGMSLVPTPEPSVMAQLAFGAGLLVCMRALGRRFRNRPKVWSDGRLCPAYPARRASGIGNWDQPKDTTCRGRPIWENPTYSAF